MIRLRRLTALVALGLCLALTASGAEKTILRLYTWNDYFDLGVLAAFEERYNCIVAIDTFDSNESMLEHVKRGGGEGYDLVTPSAYMAATMKREGLVRRLDHALVPNASRLDAAFTALSEDPEQRYSLPYTRTVTGVGYNRMELRRLKPSWSVFGRSDLSGRLTMLDDMRETLGAALKYLGYSLNTTDDGQLSEAVELLRRWRRNLAKFEVDEGNIGLGANEYLAVHGYNGDVAVVMEENPDIGFFVPSEGSAITADVFVVMSSSRNPDLAHRFINHFLEPKNAAANMAAILYYMPVPEALALLDPAILENDSFAVPAETLAKCEVIRNLGPDIAKYEAAWERVKAE